MTFPKTKKEIAAHLGIHRSTLSEWLKEKQIEIRRGYLTPDEVKGIYVALGYQHLIRGIERRSSS